MERRPSSNPTVETALPADGNRSSASANFSRRSRGGTGETPPVAQVNTWCLTGWFNADLVPPILIGNLDCVLAEQISRDVDGFSSTREHTTDRFSKRIADASFEHVVEIASVRTVFGTLRVNMTELRGMQTCSPISLAPMMSTVTMSETNIYDMIIDIDLLFCTKSLRTRFGGGELKQLIGGVRFPAIHSE